jgi:3',5'-cyclic AMP phosphodiesterase CpdA
MPSWRWFTDLHLSPRHPAERVAWLQRIAAEPGLPVIISGDISVAPRLVADLVALADAAAAPLYFVLGNHDHYGSSVADVRDRVLALSERVPAIAWLPPAGVVMLAPGTVLVGVDGWADGRHGDPLGTRLRLNDDRFISELAAQPDRRGKLAVKQALADADAARLSVLLERAAPAAPDIVVATHVPPFPDVLPKHGHLASADWLPLLVCGATGAVLRQFAAAHPAHRVTVLSGHTHIAADVMIAANLRCRVAGRESIPVHANPSDPGRD